MLRSYWQGVLPLVLLWTWVDCTDDHVDVALQRFLLLFQLRGGNDSTWYDQRSNQQFYDHNTDSTQLFGSPSISGFDLLGRDDISGGVGSVLISTSPFPPLPQENFMNKMVWDDDNIFNEVDYHNMTAETIAVRTPNSEYFTEDSSFAFASAQRSMLDFSSPPTRPLSNTKIASSSMGNRNPGATRLFGVPVSAFKGFGLSVEKSVVQWAACGMAVRLPITSHFPEYDKNQNLPRLSGSLGVTYPYGYKLSVSANLNMKTALSGVLSLMNSTGVRSAGIFLDALKRQTASDSVKRIGATFTIRYTEEKFSFTVGPWVSYIPGLAVIQHLLPVLFFVPAVVVALIGFFIPLPHIVEVGSDFSDDQHNLVVNREGAVSGRVQAMSVGVQATLPGASPATATATATETTTATATVGVYVYQRVKAVVQSFKRRNKIRRPSSMQSLLAATATRIKKSSTRGSNSSSSGISGINGVSGISNSTITANSTTKAKVKQKKKKTAELVSATGTTTTTATLSAVSSSASSSASSASSASSYSSSPSSPSSPSSARLRLPPPTTPTQRTIRTIANKPPKTPKAIVPSPHPHSSLTSHTTHPHHTHPTPNGKKNTRKKFKKVYLRGYGITHWHRKLLRWGATKTTGLGYDFGWRYKNSLYTDPSLGSRVYFEIQPFFPLGHAMKRWGGWIAAWTDVEGTGWWSRWLRYWGGVGGETSQTEMERFSAQIRTARAKSMHQPVPSDSSWHEDVEWLPEVSRMGGVDHTGAGAGVEEGGFEVEAKPRTHVILPPQVSSTSGPAGHHSLGKKK